jgi:hypothetical protein
MKKDIFNIELISTITPISKEVIVDFAVIENTLYVNRINEQIEDYNLCELALNSKPLFYRLGYEILSNYYNSGKSMVRKIIGGKTKLFKANSEEEAIFLAFNWILEDLKKQENKKCV